MRTLILTQPGLRSASLAARLATRGIETLAWPLLEVLAEPGLEARALHGHVSRAHWVILPSPAAIAVLAQTLLAGGLDWPVSTGLGLVGPGSAEALAEWRSRVPGLEKARVIQPLQPPFDAGELVAHPELSGSEPRRILVARRVDGRSDWLETLRARGHEVQALTVYRVRPLEPPPSACAWLRAHHELKQRFAWSLTSAEAGERLAGWLQAQLPGEASWLMSLPVLTVHPRLARVLARVGWSDVSQHAPGADGIIQAVESRLS